MWALTATANMPIKYRYNLFWEAFKTSTLLGNLWIAEINGKMATRFENFLGENPKFVKHLQAWGEVGTVKLKTKAMPKVGDWGKQCMMAGYTMGHTGDKYRMWNLISGRIHTTRNIIWLKQLYLQPTKTNIKDSKVYRRDILTIGPSELPTGESGNDAVVIDAPDKRNEENHTDDDTDEESDDKKKPVQDLEEQPDQ